MRAVLGLGVQSLANQAGNLLVGYASRPTGFQLVVESLDAPVDEAFAPKTYRLLTQTHFFSYDSIREAIGGKEHQPGAHRKTVRKRTGAHYRSQLQTVLFGEDDGTTWPTFGHRVPPLYGMNP